MKKERRVHNKLTGKDGKIVPDEFGICSPKEVLVLYDGDCIFTASYPLDLEDLDSSAEVQSQQPD